MTTAPDAVDTADAPAAMRTLLRRWHQVELGIALLAFTLICVLLILDVGAREVVAPLLRRLGLEIGATQITGGPKVAVYALVLGSFCGIGIATATNSHLVPRVAFRWVPAAWSPAVGRLADLVTGVLMLVVAWYGLQFVQASYATTMRAPILGWPVWPIQLCIPLGFASAAGRYLVFAAFPSLKPPPPEFQE